MNNIKDKNSNSNNKGTKSKPNKPNKPNKPFIRDLSDIDDLNSISSESLLEYAESLDDSYGTRTSYYDEYGNRYNEKEVNTIKVKIEFIENDTDKKFNKGEIVKVLRLPTSPIMIVSDIVFDSTDSNGYGPKLVGIECYWFDSNKVYHKKIFNSKDLIKLDEVNW